MEISEGFFETYDSDFVMESFLNEMDKYAIVIHEWCKKHCLKVKTKIISEAKISLTPSFSLSSQMIKFLNKTDSEIDFELSILTEKEYER
ncbi:hypothetical protein H8744_06010 [Oscillospiraceae bacterium N12]|jgi:hypothetical protein|uniref:Uncharacterized protein n=1 Tax=Jilunia laotingensis TaxID=2763675 RepID=A0A926IQL5_9BACT|nr:DUF4279 domain-containing protein [Jilunia laotingensis]MBC8592813.1 hypothetical protein [Jilunia laotingensis]